MFEKTSREALGMSGDGFVYLVEWQRTEDGLEVWAFDHWSHALDAECEKLVVGVFMINKLTKRQQNCAMKNTIRLLDYRKIVPDVDAFQLS